MSIELYNYKATVIRVIDGDTVIFLVDTGFNCFHRITTRLLGINAPEKNRKESKEKGLESKAYLEDLLTKGDIFIKTEKNDSIGKYGRWIVEIYLKLDDGALLDVNTHMVETNHAVFKDY